MSDIFVWKEKMQKLYARYSLYVNKGIQLLLGLLTFFFINRNIGLMETAASPFVCVALAVICTFLPPVCTVFAAAGLILVHMFTLSLGIAGVSALIFIMMFIFYCRFTPKKAMILLVTPLAFLMRVPYLVPVVCGLALNPIAAIPVIFGAIIYYMIDCVRTSAAAISGADGVTGQISLFVRSVFQNRELWIVCAAFVICIFVVYFLHRLSVDHAWTIAVAAGAVTNIVVIAAGDIVFDIHTSYGMLIFGNILAAVAGLVLEFFVFSVDYSRTEYLQYEDDEYYYYVKAVPKITIAEPEKTVKRINERRDTEDMEEEVIRRREPARRPERRTQRRERPANTAQSRGRRAARSTERPPRGRVQGDTDELLLAKSLRDELDIQDIVQKELDRDER